MRPAQEILLGIALWLCLSGAAISPTEAMPDQKAEAAARTLYREVRCLVCQNESLADSSADMAGDMRADIRRQLSEGKTKAQVRADLRQRYGDYVVFRPQMKAQNLILWFLPFLVLILGAMAFYGLTKSNQPFEDNPPLSEKERENLKRLTGQDL
jgi:cytochrome c-type biogenesis protein CcmH